MGMGRGAVAALRAMTKRKKGTLIVVLGMLALTPDALFVKSIRHTSTWTIVLWRYGFYGATVGTALAVNWRGDFWRRMREPGLFVIMFGAVAYLAMGLCFVVALRNASAATVQLLYAQTSAFTAVGELVVFGTCPKRRTLAMLFVCIAASVIIFYDAGGQESTNGGTDNDRQEEDDAVMGAACAVGVAFTVSIYLTHVEWHGKRLEEVSMMPCLLMGTILLTVSGGVIELSTSDVPQLLPGAPMDWLWLWLQGGVSLAICFTAMTIGTE